MMKDELDQLAGAPSAQAPDAAVYVAATKGLPNRIRQLQSTREVAFMTILEGELRKVWLCLLRLGSLTQAPLGI